jgi:hypothetical protein
MIMPAIIRKPDIAPTMKNIIRRIKVCLAIALPIFILLPIGSCQHKQVKLEEVRLKGDIGIESTEPSSAPRSTAVPQWRDYLVVIKGPVKSIEYWICLFAFIWPILLMQIRRSIPSANRFRIALNAIEVVFTIFSSLIVYTLLFGLWYKPTVLGWALLVAMTAYSLVVLVETVLLYAFKLGLVPDITCRST